MHAIAQLDSVSKLFGTFAALRQVSATFQSGRCYVITGENGAGKSTLLRIIAGLAQPTMGTVRVFGAKESDQARARIGYLSHASMLYDELSATENLSYFARLYPHQQTRTPQEALQLVGLDPALTRPVGHYSQGMRQRTSLARVLLSRPELLLLDEPFSNMDAASAQQMIALLKAQRGTSTILLTTHQPELAREIADASVVMHAGQILSFEERAP
ncbi:MAG TPA: heme ABC exporter ATP-binding protein CcmA [Acidobacteriaceae bacterium]|nr:heme ABC exporter ATP-binding protein CcmA [Acidobacteriaceae bacterium]